MEQGKLQALDRKITLNCRGRLLMLDKPLIMGIINTTPDSFFSGSRRTEVQEALQLAERMLGEGATFLDIGGYSTRPGAAEVSEEEETARVVPVVRAISETFPEAIISVDTFRAAVAGAAVNAGAHLVNDVSSGDDDPLMLQTVAALGVPYIMMHKKGTPRTMQQNPVYEDVVLEVMNYFSDKTARCKALGIKDLLLDPGFGFGKNLDHNYQLMRALGDFAIFGLPVLVGVSRKSMVQKLLGVNTAGALNGTTALHTIALQKGAAILRVHDVKEAAECIKIVNAVHGTVPLI